MSFGRRRQPFSFAIDAGTRSPPKASVPMDVSGRSANLQSPMSKIDVPHMSIVMHQTRRCNARLALLIAPVCRFLWTRKMTWEKSELASCKTLEALEDLSFHQMLLALAVPPECLP